MGCVWKRPISEGRHSCSASFRCCFAAYRVLEENGHEILPDSDKGYKDPGFIRKYLPFCRFICATKLGKLCTSAHAMNAADEKSALNRDLKRYMGQYGSVPSAWTELERDTNGHITEEA